METITPDKRKYNRLTCKPATLEAELKHARKPYEATAKVGLWRCFWGLGAKAAVVALVVVLLLLPGISCAEEGYKQKALRGLKGVEVLVETIDQEAERLGLTQEQIKTDVELRLRKAGVRVLTEKESQETPGEPYLYVMINAFVDQTPTSVGFSIRVELMEQVTLARGFKAGAAIWRTGAAGTIGARNIRKIREYVGDVVDRFINDYLAANAK